MAFLPAPAYADDLKDLKQLVDTFGAALFVEIPGLSTEAMDFIKTRAMDYPLKPEMLNLLNKLTAEYSKNQDLLSLHLLLGLRTSGLLESDSEEYQQAKTCMQHLSCAIKTCHLAHSSSVNREEVQSKLKQQLKGAELGTELEKITTLIVMIPHNIVQTIQVQVVPVPVTVFRK